MDLFLPRLGFNGGRVRVDGWLRKRMRNPLLPPCPLAQEWNHYFRGESLGASHCSLLRRLKGGQLHPITHWNSGLIFSFIP